MSDFVHLHCHTEYSLLDGAIRVKDLCSRAKDFGMPACAITDHGNLFGAAKFFLTCKDFGIKPIIGCEVYVCHDHLDKTSELARKRNHLILLSENIEGYHNLVKLVSRSYLEGFHYKPRVDKAMLRQYSEGLICLSACIAGEIPRALNAGDMDGAIALAREYADIYPDRFYLELQSNSLPEQEIANKGLLEIADHLKLPIVATNDCHYLNADDADAHEVLLCIQTQTTMDDPKRMRFGTHDLYYKSGEEMEAVFGHLPQSLSNTAEIAERCNVELDMGHHYFPVYKLPEGASLDSEFRRLAEEGLERRLEKHPNRANIDPQAYRDRLQYELKVILEMGFPGYFLIVQEFINWAKDHGIPVGPGRGSAAGSLVAWSLRITNLDPLPYNLLFERFLNAERVSLPDIDVDFCERRRTEVIQHMVDTYGKDSVAQITTFGTMKAKGVVRDVGRALGMSFAETDRIAKLVPDDLKMTINKALEAEPDLQNLYDTDPQVKKLLDTARRLEGLSRHASTHAAGVVITKRPVYEYVPLARNDESIVCQYTMVTLEELGLLKMDFLGLRNLTVLDDAVKMVQKDHPDFRLADIPMDDKATFDMLTQGKTGGVFQMESSGMTGVCLGLKPQNIEDITAIIALYRPGPMDSIPRFVACKHDPKLVTYKHPSLEPILSGTYGCIVYQEQVIKIFQELAGYSLGQADMVRRAMSKKKAKDVEREREAFLHGDPARNIRGCVASGIPEATAQAIFDEIYDFANYAFNKAHAVSYAVVAYQTAYFKCHFTREYMAALLTSVLDNSDKVAEYIAECKDCGIALLPPDVNRSYDRFTVEEGGIRFGLVAVKNIGRGFIQAVVRQRQQDGDFTSFQDFCQRMFDCTDMNKRAVENLIRCGAFDSLGAKRSQLVAVYERVLDGIASSRRKNVEGQMDLFGMSASSGSSVSSVPLPDIPEFTAVERMSMEKDTTGLYLSGHPMEDYRPLAKRAGAVPIHAIMSDFEGQDGPKRFADGQNVTVAGVITASRTRTTKNNTLMAYVTIEDELASMELLCFSRVIDQCGSYMQVNTPVLVKGRLSVRDEKPPQIMCDSLYPLESGLPPMEQPSRRPTQRESTIYLRFPSADSPAFRHIKLVMTMFEGSTPVKIRLADTGKLLGTHCLNHPALLQECREWLGEENVVVKEK